jgi:hypothetical protein
MVSIPKVQTQDRDINQLQQNIITAFTQLQQQPTTGFSGTITTAKLTSGGTQGSMTFNNGVLTAQTQAT